jgi:hypothetical protein
VSTEGPIASTFSHFITEQDFLNKEGQDIPFTLVVIYDLTEDSSRLDEKILSTVIYKVSNQHSVTGFLTVLPSVISDVNAYSNVGVSYTINSGTDSAGLFDWTITKTVGTDAPTIVRQGNQASTLLSGIHAETIDTKEGDSYDIRYALNVKESNASTYTMISNDKVTIAVPVAALLARAGYLDAAIMSYVDVLDNIRKKIGSLGTAKDEVEYANRVPRSIFTKEIPKSYLTTQAFISAPVNDFSGTVAAVYFVIELPDVWGPVSFYQTLGLVDPTAFNKIPLGNGYTVFLYHIAPSAVGAPSNYYLKPKV